MARKRSLIFPAVIVVMFFVTAAWAQPKSGAAAMSVGFQPTLQIPVGADSADFRPGGTGGAYLQYDFSQPGGLFLRGGLDYAYVPYTGGNSLSLAAVSAEAGYTLGVAPRFRLSVFAGGGYNYGFKNGSISNTGGSLYADAGLGVDFLASPSLGLTLGAAFRDYLGLMTSVDVYVGATLFLSGQEARATRIRGRPARRRPAAEDQK